MASTPKSRVDEINQKFLDRVRIPDRPVTNKKRELTPKAKANLERFKASDDSVDRIGLLLDMQFEKMYEDD